MNVGTGLKRALVASGASLSEAVDVFEQKVVAIVNPSALNGVDRMHIEASYDGGSTYNIVYEPYSAQQNWPLVADRVVVLDKLAVGFPGPTHIKLRTLDAGNVAENVTADTTFWVLTRQSGA